MSTVQPNIPFASTVFEHLETPFLAVRNFAAPAVTFIAAKIQNIWTIIQPYLALTAKFLTSKVGISLELLGLSMLPLRLSGTVDNHILSIALLAAGVLIASAGGFLLGSTGVFPPFLNSVTPVVPS